LRGPECALRFPGRADFDTFIENSFTVPDAALADVPASLRALSDPTRGFVRAEQMLDPARAEPLGGCNRSTRFKDGHCNSHCTKRSVAQNRRGSNGGR
jgi:hypothetical protein